MSKSFDDYIASLNLNVTSYQYDLMEQAWNAAISALSEQNNALTRSDNATNMQNKAANLTAIRAQEDLPDLKIIRDISDGYLYVWEKVRTQWKMRSRYRSWTDVVTSLLDKEYMAINEIKQHEDSISQSIIEDTVEGIPYGTYGNGY